MLYCLKEPIKQLEEVLKKLDKTDTDCPECDYLDSQVNDKEKFKSCIIEAIKKIEESADKYVKRMNSSYPYYTPFKELEWVSKGDFDAKKGKELEDAPGSFDLIVIRYENGEEYLYQDGIRYGLYLQECH